VVSELPARPVDDPLPDSCYCHTKLPAEPSCKHVCVLKRHPPASPAHLKEALAACWEGDTLVVTKLDRLARSLRDATAIAAELTERGARLSLGGSVHDPRAPMGRLLFNVLGMVAEFEADLIRQRTREGLRVAAAKGRLKGRPPKLSPARERHLLELHAERREDGMRKYTVGELAELFDVGRATVYRAIERSRGA
jgi:DNA invertase Pin-like site-specific DNA recombinase